MPEPDVMLAIQQELGRAADKCQKSREELEQFDPIEAPSPSIGAITVSLLSLLTVLAAVLADIHLLSAVVTYIQGLSNIGDPEAARLLVPIALATITLAASTSRALQATSPFSEYERRNRRVHVVFGLVLALQIAAAVAQFIALQAVNPSDANTPVLFFLCAFAVVTHSAVYLFAGNGVVFLAKASKWAYLHGRRRRLREALRSHRRHLFRHYQAFCAAQQENRLSCPGVPAIEIDPVVVAELNVALGSHQPNPAMPPTRPELSGPPNPYQSANPDDQRL